MKRVFAALLAFGAGCGDTGRERIEIALAATGAAARTVELGSARLRLTRADVAFGPAYFCASEAADAELCEVAVAELRETVLVRALEPAPQPLGALSGVTGEVRSALYDYGLPWLLTAPQPMASANAPDGHSAVLEGTLESAGRALRFMAAIDARPRAQGSAAVNAQRTQHELRGAGERLTLVADPHAWVDQLAPDALFALDADGDSFVNLEPGTPAHESILQGMLSRAPIGFAWSRAD